jgi:hypothetical protein
MLVTETNYKEVEAELKQKYGEVRGFDAELNGEKVFGFVRKPSRNELFSFLDNVNARAMTSMAMLYDLTVLNDYTHPIFSTDDSYYVGAVSSVSAFINVQKVELKKS